MSEPLERSRQAVANGNHVSCMRLQGSLPGPYGRYPFCVRPATSFTPSSNSYPPAPVPNMYATPKAGVVSCTNKGLGRGRLGLLAPTPCRACRRARRGTVEQHNDRHNARAARRPHSTFAPPAPTASRLAIQPFGIPTPLLSLSRGASTDAPPLIARPHTCPPAPRCRRSTALFSGYDTSV